MAASSPVEQAYQKFLATLGERRNLDDLRRAQEQAVVSAKDRQLIPLRQLLLRLVDMHLVVTNAARYTGGGPSSPPVSFNVSEDPSSPLWQPGNSLFIDHPAEIEIAIPNAQDQAEMGVVVIRCVTSNHPDAPLLNGPFRSMDEACSALAEFLGRNTEHVGALSG